MPRPATQPATRPATRPATEPATRPATEPATRPATITTERLLLRAWRDGDRTPWAELCADPEVMRHFPLMPTREQSDAMVDRIDTHFAAHGYGLWAVERRSERDFIGFVGCHQLTYDAHFTPAVEVGWRLARHAWGRGYAPEAARAAIDHVFAITELDSIVSVTVPANTPSRRVMEKLGMTRDADGDFLHPKVEDGHPLQPHVLYRLRRG